MTRREFTRSLSGTALGLSALTAAGGEAEAAFRNRKKPVALQLYTVRELASKDFTGTLEKVAKIGYDGVEFAGYGGLSSKEMKQRLKDMGLKCAGTHEGFERLEKNLGEVIDYNREIGNTFLVCPSMPGEWREKGADGFRAFGERMNLIGEKVKKAGMRLCYHNHSFEFERFGKKTGLELFYEAAGRNVLAEIDTYWVQHGGGDPADWCARLRDRMVVVHLKDMVIAEGQQAMAEVGEGNLNWPRIIDACRAAGVQWYAVEQDVCRRDPFDSLAISLRHLRAWGIEDR